MNGIHEPKYDVRLFVETLADKERQEIQQTTYSQGPFGEKMKIARTELMRLKDEGVRSALISMGWTPPDDKK